MVREITRAATLKQNTASLWLKACRRCKGDVYRENDSYGWYLQCFQCGWVKDALQKGTSGFFELENYITHLFADCKATSTGNYTLTLG